MSGPVLNPYHVEKQVQPLAERWCRSLTYVECGIGWMGEREQTNLAWISACNTLSTRTTLTSRAAMDCRQVVTSCIRKVCERACPYMSASKPHAAARIPGMRTSHQARAPRQINPNQVNTASRSAHPYAFSHSPKVIHCSALSGIFLLIHTIKNGSWLSIYPFKIPNSIEPYNKNGTFMPRLIQLKVNHGIIFLTVSPDSNITAMQNPQGDKTGHRWLRAHLHSHLTGFRLYERQQEGEFLALSDLGGPLPRLDFVALPLCSLLHQACTPAEACGVQCIPES